MQAILFDQPGTADQLYLGDFPQPEPEPGEILVKVAATALNRADIMQREGNYPPPPGASPVLGLEMAGTVTALGEGVSRWQIGDRVCGLLAGGGYAECAVIHQDLALSLPQDMSFTTAAAIPEVFLTAFQALHLLAQVQPGERVLIHAGASGVGTAAIQLARKMGAEVLVTASAPKHEQCLDLGAEKAIDYQTEDFAAVVGEYTDGRGVDVIIDFIGAPYLSSNIDALAVDGRLVLLAFMGGAKADGVSLAKVLLKRLHIMGSTLRARSLDYKTALTRAFRDFAWSDLQEGTIAPVIDSTYDWQQVQDAHRRMEANANVGKIVLRITE